jgi:hypothetical protein
LRNDHASHVDPLCCHRVFLGREKHSDRACDGYAEASRIELEDVLAAQIYSGKSFIRADRRKRCFGKVDRRRLCGRKPVAQVLEQNAMPAAKFDGRCGGVSDEG